MNRINSNELLEGLVAYGLFAERIPPFLSSEDFFHFCISNQNNPYSKFNEKSFETDFIQYESIRNINIPRELSIPNPISYFNLCKCLSDNWDKLKNHFKTHTNSDAFKVSRIHIRKIENKKKLFIMDEYEDELLYDGNDNYEIEAKKELFSMSYKNYKEDGNPIPNILVGKRFIVSADISNCFGSIYTHALSWALVGKENAKIQRSGHWHNDIDKYTMNIKNGETHGILIGCHASNLLSEIILVAVDKKMREKGYEYIRNIDDYTCYTESLEKSEKFLIDLSNELKIAGLSLNHKKTKIDPLPSAISTHWVRKLSSIKNGKFFNFYTMQQFLDNAIELMSNNHDNAAIINYAMKIISNTKTSKSALNYYIEMIHHLVLLYPYLTPLLDKYIFKKYNVPKEKIKEISTNLYHHGTKNNLNEVVSYAIYFSIRYEFYFDGLDPYNYAKESNDCIVLLLSFLYDKRQSRKITDTRMKKYRILADNLYNNGHGMNKFWLFIYEVFTAGKFRDDNSYWKIMKENNISFINKGFSEFISI